MARSLLRVIDGDRRIRTGSRRRRTKHGWRCVMNENLTRWDPFRELEEVSSRLQRVLGGGTFPFLRSESGSAFADWVPAIDVQETDVEYLIKADLPDVKREDVKVT